ncbi:hypothetical protein CUMW_081390 [Citrus unshiu]|nr:hypothetical protein CUMW_081390 [Citrus unshiu]GAY44337.1 hypothetical protein CUMW_081390 [Citrus unshiu]
MMAMYGRSDAQKSKSSWSCISKSVSNNEAQLKKFCCKNTESMYQSPNVHIGLCGPLMELATASAKTMVKLGSLVKDATYS